MDDVIGSDVNVDARRRAASPTYQAYQILHWGFVALPTLAGLDKFLHVLSRWDGYLAPAVERMLPISTHAFMMLVGVVEIMAGLLVAIKPRIGAYVVATWLVAIMVNLALHGGVLDILLRDLGLCLAAVALARLSLLYDRRLRA